MWLKFRREEASWNCLALTETRLGKQLTIGSPGSSITLVSVGIKLMTEQAAGYCCWSTGNMNSLNLCSWPLQAWSECLRPLRGAAGPCISARQRPTVFYPISAGDWLLHSDRLHVTQIHCKWTGNEGGWADSRQLSGSYCASWPANRAKRNHTVTSKKQVSKPFCIYFHFFPLKFKNHEIRRFIYVWETGRPSEKFSWSFRNLDMRRFVLREELLRWYRPNVSSD